MTESSSSTEEVKSGGSDVQNDNDILIKRLQERLEALNREVAEGLIQDIINKPQVLSHSWFLDKLNRQSPAVILLVLDWIQGMNKVCPILFVLIIFAF
jgi:hypothetical protein